MSQTGFEVELSLLDGEETQTFVLYGSLLATEGITFDDVQFNETEDPDLLDFNSNLVYEDTDSQE